MKTGTAKATLIAEASAVPPVVAPVVAPVGKLAPRFGGQHFTCAACGNQGMAVTDSRMAKGGRRRYRKCTRCGNVISTLQMTGSEIEQVRGV